MILDGTSAIEDHLDGAISSYEMEDADTPMKVGAIEWMTALQDNYGVIWTEMVNVPDPVDLNTALHEAIQEDVEADRLATEDDAE